MLIADPLPAPAHSHFLSDKKEILSEQQRIREQSSKDFLVALLLGSIFFLPEGDSRVQKHPWNENTIEIADRFDVRRGDLLQLKTERVQVISQLRKGTQANVMQGMP